MDHGSKNEINAAATLATKVLPVYYPDLVLHEEGCYRINSENDLLLVVNPDGSCRVLGQNRNSLANVDFAFSILASCFQGPTKLHFYYPAKTSVSHDYTHTLQIAYARLGSKSGCPWYFLIKLLSSSSGCLGWAMLFYCGTP